MTKYLSKCPSTTRPPLLWRISGCAPALKRYSVCKTLHLICLTVFSIRLCLDNCSVIWLVTLCYTASDTFRTLGYWELCLFRYMQTYSSIFSIIKTYSCILKRYWGIFRLIQAYSAPCVSLTYSQACHILSPGIFRTGGIFKNLWNFDQACSELCHSQNTLFMHYSAIPGILEPCVTLAYEETLHIWKPGAFRTLP